MSWRRLRLFCEQLATDPSTATWRDVAGLLSPWDLHAGLLARGVSALEIANWQRVEIHRDKDKTRPSPLPTPIKPPSSPEGDPPEKPVVTSAALLAFKKRTSGEAVA